MKTSRVDIAGVECLEVRSSNPDVGVIFFHGYGANMYDLFPLWEMWHKDAFNWYFPNGVNSLPMGHFDGRSWFSIDVIEMERAMRERRHRDLKGHLPPELDTTLHMLENLVLELSRRHKKIILGGFSQGAMCASHLAMKESLLISGLVLLSGALLAEERFPKAAKSVPFYQSHGTRDPVLSFEGAKELEKKLKELNFSGKLHPFEGGHEIPPKVIYEVKNFLDSLS